MERLYIHFHQLSIVECVCKKLINSDEDSTSFQPVDG